MLKWIASAAVVALLAMPGVSVQAASVDFTAPQAGTLCKEKKDKKPATPAEGTESMGEGCKGKKGDKGDKGKTPEAQPTE